MITSYFKTKKSRKDTSGEEKKPVSSPTSLAGRKHSRASDDNESQVGGSAAKSKEASKRQRQADDTLDPSVVDGRISKLPCPEATELLSHLQEQSWRNKLLNHVSKPSFLKLAKFVATQRSSKTVYPPPCDVFSALNQLPVDDVKVVIVGQDPYHQPNQGHGLAFSVRKGVRIPPSLRNIYKELLSNKCGLDKMPTHGYLEKWCSQGVLLLNAVLTVRESEANSHAKRGWEEFTDEIIRILVAERKKKLVFLLWGKPASKKAETIINRFGRVKHTIITTSHPSPLGATKTNSPFIGSRCFSRANDALVNMGQDPVDWGVDD
eukprot:CAMPEP_0203673928 /NCGR_PEP_ID=MMETSP0090-20130426/14414_1 /ASSEMBLY_ACC=CAM_ASM_001088 /TAXON_ID=426623 /ORGANISM="Chaetoceros affinis, Strain CCMP159" /LENGTH=320 /DNA_ID=CAMNT_0050539683 /DNA_START=25 /DNA_END=987 /DNA_ORIENTATION=+